MRRVRGWPTALLIGVCASSTAAAEADETHARQALEAALEADAPALYRPALQAHASAADPVNTIIAPAGRRLWNSVLLVGPAAGVGERLTVSLRVREASGRLLSWPADDPWLRLDRTPDGRLDLTVGPDHLRASAAPGADWQTLAVVLDGPAGRIRLVVDGRVIDARPRAPFALPEGGDWAAGPAVGDAADLALWPDALGADRLLDHHLTAEGLRPTPTAPRIALKVRGNAGFARFGCPRFSPDGRWLVGCHSNALVFVDRATGEQVGNHIEHLEPLTAVAVDPTGRAVATADGEATVQIWRVATRRPQTRLDLPHPTAGVAFSPDGRTLAAWSPPEGPGRVVRVPFDLPSATPRTTALPAPILHAAWRADGAALATALVGAPTHLIADGRPTPLGGPPATALAWHPSEPMLFTGHADGSVWRHDPDGSRPIRTVAEPSEPGDPGQPAAFAPDAPRIAPRWGTFGRPPWIAASDRRAIVSLAVSERRLALADGGGATLLDLDGAGSLALPHPAPATAVALIDGLLLTGATDGAVRRFAATDGRALGATLDDRRDAEGQPLPVRHIRPSPDGTALAVDHLGIWQARVLSIDSGAPPPPPRGSSLPALRMAVAPSGLQMLVARYTGQLTGWDLDRLRRVAGFVADSPATSLIWTAEGPRSGHTDGSVRRWDRYGRPQAHLAAHSPSGHRASGDTMPVGGVDGLFALADGTWVSSGRLTVRRWRGDAALATHPLPTMNLQIARPVMDGASRLVVSTLAGPIRVDPISGDVATLPPPEGGLAGTPIAFLAAAGPYIAGVRHTGGGQRLTVWRLDAPDGPTVDTALPITTIRLAFAADGSQLAIAGALRAPDGRWTYPILLVDPETGAIEARIDDHRTAPTAVVFEPGDPRRLHTGAWDGHQRVFGIEPDAVRLLRRRPGCPATALHFGSSRVALCADRLEVDRGGDRLTLVDDPDAQWLIGTDEGLFTASREGDRLASATAGPRLLGLDRIALSRNRPDLIAAQFGLGDAALRADLEARVRRRRARHRLEGEPPPLTELPRVELEPPIVRGDAVHLHAGARSAAGLSRWRVRADGSPVAEGVLRGASARFEASVPLIDGDNRIEVDVADRAGRWSPRARATVRHHDDRPPTLFVLAFGVSRYADPAIRDLRFAHQDALDLVARFRGAGPPWARVVTRAFTDEAVVADAFVEAESILAGAAPRDTVILFVSGHGLYDRGGVYRYLTHDAVLAQVERSVPFDRIEAMLDATAARRRLMLLDTCQSGELFAAADLAATAGSGEMQARVIPIRQTAERPTDGPGRPRLIRPIAAAPARADDRRDRFVDRDLRRARGAVVFSSSRGAEASWEIERLANGAFTEAILEGLAGAADPDDDGWITLPDLRAHVAARVAELTGDRQHPTIDRENRAARIRLPRISAP